MSCPRRLLYPGAEYHARRRPVHRQNPAHIFITHNHIDHVAGLPFSLFCNDKAFRFQVYGPAAAEGHIKRYVASMFELNDLLPPGQFDPALEKYLYHGYSEASSFRLTIKKILYEVDVVLCDHTVPAVSYCFSEIRQRLKEEHRGKAGPALYELKAAGVAIMEEFKKRLFAFICDSSIAVLEAHPEILKYPVIFIECTFLHPDEIELARKCKHIHWTDLEAYVRRHPDTLFVLIHFTLRHDEATIIRFFQEVRDKTGVG